MQNVKMKLAAHSKAERAKTKCCGFLPKQPLTFCTKWHRIKFMVWGISCKRLMHFVKIADAQKKQRQKIWIACCKLMLIKARHCRFSWNRFYLAVRISHRLLPSKCTLQTTLRFVCNPLFIAFFRVSGDIHRGWHWRYCAGLAPAYPVSCQAPMHEAAKLLHLTIPPAFRFARAAHIRW